MSDFADDFSERIAAGESPVAVMLSLLPESQRQSLARCAIVRMFDNALYERHLQVGDASLIELLSRGWVEKAAGQKVRYQIAPHLREDAWNLWWQDNPPDDLEPSAELREISARLAEYFAEIDWPMERLRHLVLADVGEAEQLFTQIYQEADQRFDLAYCQDAVDALTEPGRVRFLSATLKTRHDEYQRRITARALRATEYYQTREARYQPRWSVQAQFDRLLVTKPDSPRVLLLHGHGGTGKSTMLHWFISRVCVIGEPVVACVRINCDTLDPVAVLERPWLLLIEAAEQLNRQLPQGPFLSFLRAFGHYRGRLRRIPAATDSADSDWQRIGLVAHEVETRFCSSALIDGPPVLIALDGLDEITTRSRAAPEPLSRLTDLLLRVQDRLTNLRFVLAGRDNLSQLVPRFSADPGVVDIAPGVISVAMPPFDENEAIEYLNRRKVTDGEQVRAVYRKSAGLPMVVALYADLIEKEPSLTGRQIEENTEPVIEYLITRILRHIADPIIRGALLYSVVVPAELSFDFFCGVMMTMWRAQALDGGIPDELDVARPTDGPRNEPYHPPGPDDLGELRQLWKEVVAYAAKSTWISVQDSDGEQAVVVHSDVRTQLRAEVRGHETFARLHEQAARHWQLLADDSLDGYEPADDWLDRTKAVIYHRFQQQDPEATSYWRAALGKARSLRRVDWVHDLAEYILHPDFQDADGHPDLAVLSHQLLYEADVELARVAAQNAGRLPGQPPGARPGLWSDQAMTALADAGAVWDAAAAQQVLQAADYEAIVSALVSLEAGDLVGALARLDELAAASDAARGDASLVRARAYAGQHGTLVYPDRPDAALQAYLAAYDHHTEPDYAAYVALDAAQWLLSIDRPDLALEWCDRGDAAWPSAANLDGAAAEVRAQVLHALGRPGSALAALVPPPGRSPSAQARCLAAEARLALRQPRTAVDELTAQHGPWAEVPGAEDSVGARIEHELLLARVYGELFEIDRAEHCFERAQRQLTGQADQTYQAQINTARALFELRVVGDVLRAGTYLAAEFDSTAVPPGQSIWTELQLARVELADRQQRVADVRRILDEVREKLIEARASASCLAVASMAGLASRSLPWTPDRRDHLKALNDDLTAIAPEARLATVAGLVRCKSAATNRKLADRLQALVASEGSPRQPDADADVDAQLDQAWRDLMMAQVLRIAGDRSGSAHRRATALLALRADPFVRWELLAADAEYADRPAAPPDPDTMPPDPYQFHEHYGHYFGLFAAFMTEYAYRYDRGCSREEAYLWLREARRNLDARQSRRRTAWHARLYEVLTEYARTREETMWDYAEKAAEIWAELGVYRQRPDKAQAWSAPAPASTNQAGVTELILSDGDRAGDIRLSQRRASDDPPGPGKPLLVGAGFAHTDLGIDTLALTWGQKAGERLREGMNPLLAKDGHGEVDVRIEFQSLGLAADPWELLAAGGVPLAAHRSLRFISRGAGDALSRRHQWRSLRSAIPRIPDLEFKPDRRIRAMTDPAIVAWLAEFHRQRDLTPDPAAPLPETWQAIRAALRVRASQQPERRPLRVRVIQPVVGGDLDTYRGLGDRLDELVRTYRTAFGEGRSPNGPELDLRITHGDEVTSLYAGTLRPDEAADVLHVCTVMEATEQMPVLGLDAGSGPPLTAPELDLLVQRLTRAVPPVVVLDVQAPPSPAETRRQLLMRNRFAHQLLALGGVNTIIASGLASRFAGVQWQFIAEGLAESRNPAEICRMIQRHQRASIPDGNTAEDDDIHAVAFTASALFTSVRADSLIEPGLIA